MATKVPTKGETQALALREAARHVMGVVTSLDASTDACACCGRLQPVDKVEHRAFEALTQVRQKLLDWADTLALPPEERDDSPAARRLRQQRDKR